MLTKTLRTLLSFSIGVSLTPLAQAPVAAAEAAVGRAAAAVPTQSAASLQEGRSPAARDLFVTVGKSLVVDSPVNIHPSHRRAPP